MNVAIGSTTDLSLRVGVPAVLLAIVNCDFRRTSTLTGSAVHSIANEISVVGYVVTGSQTVVYVNKTVGVAGWSIGGTSTGRGTVGRDNLGEGNVE